MGTWEQVIRGFDPLRDRLAAATVRRAARSSPYYREVFRQKGLDPAAVVTAADIERLGFFTQPEDLVRDDLAFLAVPSDAVHRIGASSGTFGTRKRVHLTRKDWKRVVRHVGWGLKFGGGPTRDRCLSFLLSPRPEWFLGDLIEEGSASIGIPFRLCRSVRAVDVLEEIRSFEATVLLGTPAFLFGITKELVESRELSGLGVTRIHLGNEPWSEEVRRFLERAWGARALDHYGMMELGGLVAWEIPGAEGLVVNPYFYLEVVEPTTGAPVPIGKVGELVFTTLGREGSPLIRYRTGDLAARLPAELTDPVSLVRISRIHGRIDDMVVVGLGRNLHPTGLEEILLPAGDVVSFQLIVGRETTRDTLTLRVEAVDGEGLEQRLISRLWAALPVLEMDVASDVIAPIRVEILPPGALREHGKTKVRRIVDRRTWD